MNALNVIKKVKLLPVIEAPDADVSEKLAAALCAGGLPAAEITFRTPCAEEVIRRMKAVCPQMTVGAGTIISRVGAEKAAKAGAEFIVGPGFSDAVAEFCNAAQITYIPGCVTATEIIRALEHGIYTVKFFPAGTEGGSAAIKALAAPFPDVSFMPTGGVNAGNLREYLTVPAVIACGGSWIAEKRLLAAGDFAEIERRCREAADIVSGACQ